MGSVDFSALAERLGVSVDQVLEVAALGRDLPEVTTAPVAGCTARPRIVLDAVDLDRSCAERARPETDAEWRFAEEYAERWDG